MTHPDEEDLVSSYYADLSAELKLHLEACSECASLYRNIRETLDTAAESRLPERGDGYGAEVWARLMPLLPSQKSKTQKFPRWLFAPAVAAFLSIVFLAGMLTEHKRTEPQLIARTPVPAPATPRQKPVMAINKPPKPTPPRHRARLRTIPAPVEDSPAPSDTDQDQKLLALNSQLSEDGTAALPELLDMVTGDTSDKTKEHALFVLAQSDSPQAHKALLDFAQQSSNPSLQTKAVRMMGMMGNDGTRKELVGLYTSSSSQGLKREILNDLMLSGAQTELSHLYKSGAPYDEKKQILNSVFLTGDANMLVDILKQEKDPGFRVDAVNSLAVMNGRATMLANVYRTDTNDEVRRAVLDALVKQQNVSTLSQLAHDETDLRRRAEILHRLDKLQMQLSACVTNLPCNTRP